MKKNKHLGILALIVGVMLIGALALSLTGCDNGNGGNEVTEFTVIFNLEGGNIDGNESAFIIPVKDGKTIDNLPAPQRTPYDFGGWFTAKNGAGNEFTSATKVTSDVTVFAKWTLINYTSTVTQLSDTRFNGVFTGTREYSNINVSYDLKLTFDGTNKIQSLSQRTENGIKGDPSEFTYEMEIDSDGKYRRRLWSNPFDTWTEWLNYEFSQDGNRLTIQWYDSQAQGSYDVYDKVSTQTVLAHNSIERAVIKLPDNEEYLMVKQLEEKQREDFNRNKNH